MTIRTRRLAGLAVGLLTVWSLAGADVRDLLESRSLWTQTPAALARRLPGEVKKLDRQRNALSGRSTVFGETAHNLVYRFNESSALERIEGSIWNRGDAVVRGESTDARDFKERRLQIAARIREYAGVPPQISRTNLDGHSVVTETTTVRPDLSIQLIWSTTRNAPEYLNFRILSAPATLRSALKTGVARAELPQRVQTAPDGTRWIEVPMVDQGRKGYCVDATVERMLRYYGSELDQHIVAQLASSSATGGTLMSELLKTLYGLDVKLGVRIRELYTNPAMRNWDAMERMLKNYNREARRSKRQIDVGKFVRVENGWKKVDMNRLFAAVDLEIYKKFRCGEREFKLFRSWVRESIDRGIPLVWGIAGPQRQKFSRHLRIINGYNDARKEIIYTDSWGAGHERKIMGEAEAWAITGELLQIEPRNR